MKITNKYNLPAVYEAANRNDPYDDEGSFATVTRLINTVRQFWLEKRHRDEIVLDIADMTHLFSGQIWHSILERAGVDNALQEERLHMEICGKDISGQIDLYEADGTLTDFKETSIYTPGNPERMVQYTKQLNFLAVLLRHNGCPVEKAQIFFKFKDWSRNKTQYKSELPQHGMGLVECRLWNARDALEDMSVDVNEFILWGDADDNALPPCTEEEMWAKPPIWAVKKKGNKTAMRGGANFTSEQSAREFISHQKHPCDIEFRPGSRNRCGSPPTGYCDVSPFCSQYQDYLKEKESDG